MREAAAAAGAGQRQVRRRRLGEHAVRERRVRDLAPAEEQRPVDGRHHVRVVVDVAPVLAVAHGDLDVPRGHEVGAHAEPHALGARRVRERRAVAAGGAGRQREADVAALGVALREARRDVRRESEVGQRARAGVRRRRDRCLRVLAVRGGRAHREAADRHQRAVAAEQHVELLAEHLDAVDLAAQPHDRAAVGQARHAVQAGARRPRRA